MRLPLQGPPRQPGSYPWLLLARLLETGVDERILEIKRTLTRERRTSWAHLKTPEGGLLSIVWINNRIRGLALGVAGAAQWLRTSRSPRHSPRWLTWACGLPTAPTP